MKPLKNLDRYRILHSGALSEFISENFDVTNHYLDTILNNIFEEYIQHFHYFSLEELQTNSEMYCEDVLTYVLPFLTTHKLDYVTFSIEE